MEKNQTDVATMFGQSAVHVTTTLNLILFTHQLFLVLLAAIIIADVYWWIVFAVPIGFLQILLFRSLGRFYIEALLFGQTVALKNIIGGIEDE